MRGPHGNRLRQGSDILRSLERDGWDYDGDLRETIGDMESDRVQDNLLLPEYEYLSVNIMLKRKKKDYDTGNL